MKMNEKTSIIIIGVYYGTFPVWMPYWLRSCADNPTIDFLLVTDIKIENLPKNVSTANLSMNEFKRLAEEKIGMKIAFNRPYKACDLKPCYGVIMEDYIKGYDYWGHCDFDLIWGDIRYFVQKYEIEKYDKFLPFGHLALYRNTNKCNRYYKLPGSKCGNYTEVFSSQEGFAFDETDGIYSIYEANGLPMFTSWIFANIKTYHKRFKLKRQEKNYKHQVFYYENGKTFRAYEEKGEVKREEFIYIHFRRKLPSNEVDWRGVKNFYISPNGFFAKKTGVPVRRDMEKYNHNPGWMMELWETLKFCMKNIGTVRAKISNEILARKMNS